MYLRYTTRKKDGKVHRTWRLVRSVRIGRRVIQQTVAHLGKLDDAGRLRAGTCADRRGNTRDSTTVQTIVATMEARHGAVGKVWIMDRGMASADNVAWLRQTGRRYLLGTPKSELRPWAPALAKLQARIASAQQRVNRDTINRQNGRLLQRNQRAAV